MSDSVLATIWAAAGGAADRPADLRVTGTGDLPSAFAVTDLATASVGAACLALAELIGARHGTRPIATVDRRLASFWFKYSVRPQGWKMDGWDAVAGDYATADGWIRLHTNAPHHRQAALTVLGVPADRTAVAAAVSKWTARALEDAVVAQNGCAAEMRSCADWAAHPQGQAVAAEPLLHRETLDAAPTPSWPLDPVRPLRGLRVLDMTRVLAGPVATRFLAGFGADVLRIDPPVWDEPASVLDVVLGKRCARLDLRNPTDRATWESLLRGADVMVHGYRSDALERLGLGVERRRELCPGLVDVSLDAYGFTGPWRTRRGFDSLLQMSSGIAHASMLHFRQDKPTPLPCQALDHATGYLLATAVLRGLTERLTTGAGSRSRSSLARMAALLTSLPVGPSAELAQETEADLQPDIEPTPWGPARRLRPPGGLDCAAMRWDFPSSALGSSKPVWQTA